MMKTNKLLYALIAFVVAFPFATAEASVVVRTGETVSVAEDQSIDGDFYSAASIINISGEIAGDLSAAGGRTTINGTVTDDALLIGGSVDVHGSVGDDLRVIGGEVVVAEPITGDVFVLGGSVSILSTASVGGDVLIFGGDVEISGPVGGSVLGHSSTLRLDSEIAGDVDVTTNQLTIGDRAVIEGNLTYVSSNLLVRSQDASISGEVVRNDPVMQDVKTGTRDIIVAALIILFTVAVWFLIARKQLAEVVFTATARRPRPMLLGLGTLFLGPLAIMLLMISVLGMVVGMALLFTYILVLILGLVALSAVAGQFALKIFNQPSSELTLLTLAAGVITVMLLSLLPVIGPLVLFGLFILSVGAIVDHIVEALTHK